MKTQKVILSAALVACACCTGGFPAAAQNLLTNGDLEAGTTASLPGWTLEETVTGMPGATVDSAELSDFDVFSDGQGLWLKAFAGNTGAYQDQNVAINANLVQVVDAVEGETYTFSGNSSFEEFYSGANSFMDPDSPSGFIESPTESRFEIAFLDSTGAVLGTPMDLDLRTVHPEPGDRTFRESSVSATAPTGAAEVRVRAYANDMLFNLDSTQQSAFYDNFSLKTGDLSGPELLTNPNLDVQESTEFFGWDVTELPEGSNTINNTEAFSNRPASGGALGGWLRGFVGGDGYISQTVEGVEGGDYEFSGWFIAEQNYVQADTFLQMEFLDDQESVIGDPIRIDIFDEGFMNVASGGFGGNPDGWQQFSIDGTSPTGTASVRVTVGAEGMMNNPSGGAQSAAFDDLVLTLETAALAGDFNGDGFVDGGDLSLLLGNWGSAVPPVPDDWDGTQPTGSLIDADELSALLGTWGQGTPPAAFAGSAQVPEPTTVSLMGLVLVGGAMVARRTRAGGA